MTNETEVKVPDIGGAHGVDVIDIMVKPGDKVKMDTPLITLESDKASMDIPSPLSGVVTKIKVKTGDKVSEGDLILSVKTEEEKSKTAAVQDESPPESVPEENKSPEKKPTSSKSQEKKVVQVCIPDIGGSTNVDVIDILVTTGMKIEQDQALVTLEGDKATMDIPSPHAGVVKEITIHLGDKVSQGSPILSLETSLDPESEVDEIVEEPKSASLEINQTTRTDSEKQNISLPSESDTSSNDALILAGPAVRRIAREFGINLSLVKGSGRKSRITSEDLQTYVKQQLAGKATSGNGFNLPTAPVIDFSKFGQIEMKPLNKIKKLTGINVHRSWLTIPQVTQFDEADITDLEAFRKQEMAHQNEAGYKLTVLAFVCKVIGKALNVFPQFNTSLDSSGEQLVYKKYCNIGIAMETPNGLVVAVIKQSDQLTVSEIAQEMTRLSTKAREKGLSPDDMAGSCFTISSLGGIGGTAFTPIVNGPEVAILGLSRASIKPVYKDNAFEPRLMLPLSLTYDHRVIDGAEAARFTRYLSESLSDIRKILL